MDATHPQHNPVIGYGRIKCGEEHPVKRNTTRGLQRARLRPSRPRRGK